MADESKKLGKELDAQLSNAGLPQLMKDHGFKANRNPRRWGRDFDGCRQVAGVYVDGRSAPDGYLVARLECGIRFDDEPAHSEIAGEKVAWTLKPLSVADNEWRFDAAAIDAGVIGSQIVERMAQDIIPLLDRLGQRRKLRDYFAEEGIRLAAVRELSLAIGDRETAREVAQRDLEQFVADLKRPNPPSHYAALDWVEIVEKLDLELSADDRQTLEQGTRLT